MATTAPALDKGASIAERINWIMQQVDYIQKVQPDTSKPAAERLAYSVITHDSVTAKLRPVIVKAGVIYYPLGGTGKLTVEGNRTQFHFQVRFENIYNRDDFLDVETLGFGVDKQDKGPGKAISYGVKYALLEVFGLETGDDPDLNQGDDANFRSTLDSRIEELETAVRESGDTLTLTNLMNSEPTKQIMAAAQTRNPSEFERLRKLMSNKAKALKASEKPAGAKPNGNGRASVGASGDKAGEPMISTGAASGEDAGLGGSS